MIEVEYHADLKEVQSDGALATLLSATQQSAPFDRLDWWQALSQHCGLAPLLATARDGSDMVVLPLARDADGLIGLANWYTFRLRAIVSSCGRGHLLSTLARDLASKADRVMLTNLPGEDDTAASLAAAFREAGWLTVLEPCGVNHYLAVEGRDYASYLAGRPGALRTTLKRKSGKVATEILTRFDPEAWAAYEAIYGMSWKPDEGSPAFLRAFAETEGAAGRLRLGLARIDGAPAAAQMWTVEGGTAWIHKLAHREDSKALSPGSVLSAALFRHVIDIDRVATVDFGTGDDAYKRDWMEQVRPRFRLAAYRPMALRNWPEVAKIGLRRLAAAGKRG